MLKRLILVLEVISILYFLITIFFMQLKAVNIISKSGKWWHIDEYFFPVLFSFVPFMLIILAKYIFFGKFYLFLESFKLRESSVIKRVLLLIQISYSIPVLMQIGWIIYFIFVFEDIADFLQTYFVPHIICPIPFVLTIYIKYLIYGKVFIFKFKGK